MSSLPHKEEELFTNRRRALVPLRWRESFSDTNVRSGRRHSEALSLISFGGPPLVEVGMCWRTVLPWAESLFLRVIARFVTSTPAGLWSAPHPSSTLQYPLTTSTSSPSFILATKLGSPNTFFSFVCYFIQAVVLG